MDTKRVRVLVLICIVICVLSCIAFVKLSNERPIPYFSVNGHIITLKYNESATDPSYIKLMQFLKNDKTDRIRYERNKFVCSEYAELLQRNASDAGIRCGYVHVTFTDGALHACNVFNTTDRGLIFIDDTSSTIVSGPTSRDRIVNINKGADYDDSFIFDSVHWTTNSMGIVADYNIDWIVS
jgi:hypothetical protein